MIKVVRCYGGWIVGCEGVVKVKKRGTVKSEEKKVIDVR